MSQACKLASGVAFSRCSMLPRWAGLALVLLMLSMMPWAISIGCASPPVATGERQGGTSSMTSIAIYTLSRGKGVPDPTRSALRTIRALVDEQQQQGLVTRVEETRIGLEGETRLCVEFKDSSAAREAGTRIRGIAAQVELLNIVEEPCAKR